jgi:DNA-binding CsgD family transcriptional regulator
MSTVSLHELRNSWQIRILAASFIVLYICEGVLIMDILTEYLSYEFQLFSENHALIEAIAVVFLGIALFVVGFNFMRLLKENNQFRSVLGVATGEFLYILGAKFTDWNLSVSEREIALLLIKGLSIHEIADIRTTKTGTIKSQCSSVYRKAEVKGRNELVAYFVEDLLSGDSLAESTGPSEAS